MRRLPVYFLLDVSGSMYGEPIEALNNALSGMVQTLKSDGQAADSVWLSLITFGGNADTKVLEPLTELNQFQLPDITCPQSGPTNTGKGLEILLGQIRSEVKKTSLTTKGDWRPLLFLFTDGKPSDGLLYSEMIPQIKAVGFAAVVGCAAGRLADDSKLRELTNTVVHLDTCDSITLKAFFKWVSEVIDDGNKSQGTGEAMEIPPPPSEIISVI